MAKKAPGRSKSGLLSHKKLARKSGDKTAYNKAIEAFEKALKVLHRGDFERAKSQFEAIVTESQGDPEIADRAQAYLTICDRQRKSSFSPRTFEEFVAYGVFCHNRGEYDRAIKYLSKATEMDPGSDHAHYCLAAAYSRHGDSADAARHLKQAVHSDTYNRVLAKGDEDFAMMRDQAEIAELLASAD